MLPRVRHLIELPHVVGILADLRNAARRLRSSVGFTLAAVATLAVGIGATTAIYSVVEGVLLAPLPFSHPDRVVALYQRDRKKGIDHDDVAPANFLDWAARSASYSAVASAEPFALDYQAQDGVEQVYDWNVSQDFFRVLDARPVLGRLFVPSDFTPGPPRVLILTYASWQKRFGADRAIIGRQLRLSSGVATVVGVLPANFDYLASTKMELYAPKVLSPGERRIRNIAWYKVVARLAPGVSLEAARRDLARVAGQLAAEYPSTNATVGATVEPLATAIVGDTRRPLALLFGAVLAVLLIACVNVANLALAHGVRRRREFAVRGALGASRARIARQLTIEHLAIATIGGALGAIGAVAIVRVIRASSRLSVPRVADVRVDARALAFAALVIAVCTVIVGLLPAMRATNIDHAAELRAGARASGDATHRRLRRGLVVAEIALAFVLLAGAGLLVRSFVSVVRGDRGYRSDHVLAAPVFVYRWNPTPNARVRFVDALVRRAAAVPGVVAAGATSSLPLDIAIGADQGTFTIDGRSFAVGDEPSAHMTAMTPTAFDALRIPLRAGRVFTAADDSAAAPVVVINQAMVRRYWPGADPIGRRLRFAFYSAPIERTIVGVVADTRQRALDAPAEPIVYVPHAQASTGAMVILLRTRNAPRSVLRDFRRAVADLNPALPLAGVETLDELVAASLEPRAFAVTLLSAFALCALVLALVGVYAVVNQSVLDRRGEIGVRLALGALPNAILGTIMREGMLLALTGVVGGGAGAAVLDRLLGKMLVDTKPFDPATFAAVAVIVFVIAALASATPALRAAGVDPVGSLRAD